MAFYPSSRPQNSKPSLFVFKEKALPFEQDLLKLIHESVQQSPFRPVKTSTGKSLSVRISNLGDLGWYTDETGYHYTPTDPQTQQSWPILPDWLV